MHTPLRLKRFPLILLLAILPACAPLTTTQPVSSATPAVLAPRANQSTPIPTELPSLTPTPEPSSTASPSESPLPNYDITANYDFPSHQLEAVERITWHNETTEALEELLLVTDAAAAGARIFLNDIEAAGGPPVSAHEWASSTWLKVRLAEPLQPGQAVQLNLSYLIQLPERVADPDIEPMVLGWSARQINLVDWIFYLPPWREGSGWWVNQPGYYGEHEVYASSDFVVGLEISAAPEGLVVAGPSPALQDGPVWRFELKKARTFALSILPEAQSATEAVNGIPVTSYWFTGSEKAGREALRTAVEALELFAALIGPYPHSSLTVIQADFLDSMEFDGLVFVSNGFYNLYDGTRIGWLTTITAHEVVHQWWFSLVANDQALEPWVDEALCTFSEKLFLEHKIPEAVGWWDYGRLMVYEPSGPVNDTIYNPRHRPDAYLAYRNAVYLNGAVMYQTIRDRMGEEKMLAALREYAETYAWKIATGDELWAILQKHSEADLSSVRASFFTQ